VKSWTIVQMATRASMVESVSTPKTEWNANVVKDMEDRYVKLINVKGAARMPTASKVIVCASPVLLETDTNASLSVTSAVLIHARMVASVSQDRMARSFFVNAKKASEDPDANSITHAKAALASITDCALTVQTADPKE